MNTEFINQLFNNHFKIKENSNDRCRVLSRGVDISTCNNILNCSSGGIKERKMKYNAIYIHYTGEEDNGMDSHEIQAVDYESAWKLAISYPGRLYKLTEKS